MDYSYWYRREYALANEMTRVKMDAFVMVLRWRFILSILMVKKWCMFLINDDVCYLVPDDSQFYLMEKEAFGICHRNMRE
jgi:hypothetical protein